MIASGEDSPEALSGFVKFHPQYPVLKVPGGACGPPCASRSRLARGCILRASPPRVKGKFGFGRIYCGARADSAKASGFSQLAQSLPRGPCRPSLWRNLHNLPLTAQSFRDSQDKSFAFHGASFAAWAKAPAVPLDWPFLAVASAIDQGRPAGRWSACRPFYRSGDGASEIAGEEGASEPTADPRQPAKRFPRGQSRVPEPRGAHAAPRRTRPRPVADRLDAPERVRRGLLARGAGARERPGLAMPMRGGGALSVRALEWAGESGRTRKGRRPAPTPLNETRFLPYKPFPSYGPGKQKKRGPPSPAGPSGIRGGA